MPIASVACFLCDTEMSLGQGNYDVGRDEYYCDEHYRVIRLEDLRTARDHLQSWLDITHLKRLRELDKAIAELEAI